MTEGNESRSATPSPEDPADIVEVTSVVGAAGVHPAAAYFGQRLREISESMRLREVASEEVHKLSPTLIHAMLQEQAPGLAVSPRQIYRYYSGAATPRIDVVYEIARLFGVSPRVFLPPTVDSGGDSVP